MIESVHPKDKITVKTGGNNNSISDMYNDINSKNYNYVMNCNNSTDHILDMMDLNNIDILKNINMLSLLILPACIHFNIIKKILTFQLQPKIPHFHYQLH